MVITVSIITEITVHDSIATAGLRVVVTMIVEILAEVVDLITAPIVALVETGVGLGLAIATKDVNLEIGKAVAMVVAVVSIMIATTVVEDAVPMAVELAAVGPFSEVLVAGVEVLVVHPSPLIDLLTQGLNMITLALIGLLTLIVVDIAEKEEMTTEVTMDTKEATAAVVVVAMGTTAVQGTVTTQLVKEDDTNKLGIRLVDHRLLNKLLLGRDSITEASKEMVLITEVGSVEVAVAVVTEVPRLVVHVVAAIPRFLRDLLLGSPFQPILVLTMALTVSSSPSSKGCLKVTPAPPAIIQAVALVAETSIKSLNSVEAVLLVGMGVHPDLVQRLPMIFRSEILLPLKLLLRGIGQTTPHPRVMMAERIATASNPVRAMTRAVR